MKRIITAALALMLALSMATAALAEPSPVGTTIEVTSDNATVTVDDVTPEELGGCNCEDCVREAMKEEYGVDYEFEYTELLVTDIHVVRTDDKPVTFRMNVAGVKRGDTIVVVHHKTPTDHEIVIARVIDDGLIEFTLSSFSPVYIYKLTSGDKAVTLPQTGDSAAVLPFALILAAAFMSAIALKRRAS